MNFDLTDDQRKLQATVADFAQSEVAPVADALDHDGVFPTELFKKVGELGVTAIPFSEELGGMGLGVLDMVIALEQLARADQSLAVSVMVSVASGLTLARFGDAELAGKYLPDIVAGRKICGIGYQRLCARRRFRDGAVLRQKLHRFVGRGKALEWILLGRHLSAAEVEPFGLLYAVAEPGLLLDTALGLARALKALSPNAIAQAKTSIYIADDSDSRSARRAGLEALTALVGGRDWKERMAAFAEKRKPRFDTF